ncbi:MAG: DinB family protein [Phycisphaerae bacterium]
MPGIGSIIAASATLTPMYAERLIDGIKPETAASFARPGGVIINSNHPTFVFGHLNLYAIRVFTLLGLPTDAAKYPPEWDALFKAGVECTDDPTCAKYPNFTELTAFFSRAYTAAIAAIRDARDERFLAANPAEGRMKELFPTIGAAITFYVGSHPQSHFGQVSAWRRMMGLPPA